MSDISDKSENFRQIAAAFADGIKALNSVDEIAIFGSLAGGVQYPSDVDVAVIVNSLADITQMARMKRKKDNANYLDVFVFTWRAFVGNLCHRRDCPGASVECAQPGCGAIQSLRIRKGLKSDPARWFKTPVTVIHKRGKKSILQDWQKEILRGLGLTAPESYPVRESILEKCRECGDRFGINPGEQKYFEDIGFDLPKRCQSCRDKSKGLGFDC